MPISKRNTRKVPDYVRVEDSPNQRISPGPFIGVVKNNFDPYHSGRLEVYIAELGGSDPDNPTNWKTVSYCTPFYGLTPNNSIGDSESFQSRHSYGMWFTPPDIEVRVLCIFVNGNPDQGYWFGCLPDRQNHFMVPALGGTDLRVESKGISTEANRAGILPTVEFNDKISGNLVNQSFMTIKKHPHDEQAKILMEQGLQADPIRGVTTSSSQRETPSNVFGISTPGRPNPDLAEGGQIAGQRPVIKNRKGGHQFVMDDGDIQDNYRMFRLRSSSGHQIMMNDTQELMYIANAKGTVWLQFHNDGNVEIFSANNISIRTEKEIDLHADSNIRINTAERFQLYAAGGIDIESGKDFSLFANDKILQTTKTSFNVDSGGETRITSNSNINLEASSNIIEQAALIKMNSGAGARAEKSKPIQKQTLQDAEFNSGQMVWEFGTAQIKNTIVKKAPTHEPYELHAGENIVEERSFLVSDPGINEFYGAEIPIQGIIQARQLPKQLPVDDQSVIKQPSPPGATCNLSEAQTKSLMAAIGKRESNGDYQAVNSIGFSGKYQFGLAALQDLGYIKDGTYRPQSGINFLMDDPNVWTGKDGINSKEDFLNSPDIQEKIMFNYMEQNCTTMQRIGALSSQDEPDTVGGMIMAAHLKGAGGAKDFRAGRDNADAFGTKTSEYFNIGSGAVKYADNNEKIVNSNVS